MTALADSVLWRPSEQRVQASEMTRFARWLDERAILPGPVTDYAELHRWSCAEPDAFWGALAQFYDIDYVRPPSGRLAPTSMPGGGWFPGTTLNYAAQVFAGHRSGVALVSVAEDGVRTEMSWAQLRGQVGALAAWLRAAGVKHGDRVAAVLPVGEEAVIAQLASAAVGAVWSVVSPEFGEEAVISRLGQLEPVVLFAVDSYVHGGRTHDRSEVMRRVLAELGSVREVVWVGAAPESAGAHLWADVLAGEHELVIDDVDFEHPLWVLFSSGTTGVPKGIVHGHGGIVLEHRKVLGLHADLGADGVLLVVGSTSWVVWTMQVSGLLTGATIVILQGHPAAPLDRVWQVAAAERVSVLGLGAAYVHACLRAGLVPRADYDLSALRMLQVTGSVLSAEGYEWVYEAVGDLWLASMSGGTDVASIFVGGVAWAPVRAGRIQGAALGVAAAAWDETGRPVLDTRGELVVTAPMPSMPLCFFNDPDGRRYRDSYFQSWPGIWRHGDVAEFDADGSCVIHGRSDSTLNRNGIRMGSADLYRVVEALPEVREALVVGVEEGVDYYLPLYVHLADGVDREQAFDRIRLAIRSSLSPRYLPDEIVAVRAVPHTRTGKKLEVPVKRLLQGAPLEQVVDLGAVDDAALLQDYAELAVAHRSAAGSGAGSGA